MPERHLSPRQEQEVWPTPPPRQVYLTSPFERAPAVIADANALIADSIRRTRGLFNVMPFLAQRKLIRLLTADHIDEKVYARLPEACENARADLAAATHAYETVHRPLLRLVDLGELMLHDRRVDAVALADPEDVPVAQLGVLLAPSLVLTQDPDLIGAGIGVHDWADALVLMKELIELDAQMWGATAGVVAAGTATAYGVSGFVRLLRRSELALGIVIGLAVGFGYHFREQLRTAPAKLNEQGRSAAENALAEMTTAFERRAVAHRRVGGTLVAPHEMETLEATVARVLVQHHEPIRGDQIHAGLPYAWREVAVEDVMSVLREHNAFRLIRGRGWVLGRQAPPRS